MNAVLTGSAIAALALPDDLSVLRVAAAATGGGGRVLGGHLLERASTFARLDDTELAVLRALARGASNSEIASECSMSISSTKRELIRLRSLLSVASRDALRQVGRDLALMAHL